MISNMAALFGNALSAPLSQAVRAASQTPGPAQPKSKISAPEKYSGKTGNAAKAFILDCRTYFFTNPFSFPSDVLRIMYVLSSMKEGIPKQWGQQYLTKWVSDDAAPILDDWAAFEAGVLAN